jgi:DNA repair exonuclease SbcCD ATPase subunit
MAGASNGPSLGELIVQPGKRGERRVAMPLPVCILGSGDQADINLPSADPVHAIVTVTPAGPMLRAWGNAHRNGEPCVAAILQDGDTLNVAGVPIKFQWHGQVFEPGPMRMADLLLHREAVRKEIGEERAKLKEEQAEFDSRNERLLGLRELARTEREKSHRVYQRFLKRMKVRWTTERHATEAERVRLRKDVDGERKQIQQQQTDLDKRQADLKKYQQQLGEAWQLLTDSQRRLLDDRTKAEQWIKEHTQAVELREASVERIARQQVDQHDTLDARKAALEREIESLEGRALNARAVLKQLEDQRSTIENKHEVGVSEPLQKALVSLEAPRFHPGLTREAEQLLTEIQTSHQATQRERAKLAVLRTDLERRETELTDHRAILTEHVAALAAARDQWHDTESKTFAEMEEMTRAVRLREQAIEEREHQLNEAEGQLLQKSFEQWHLRQKLDGWQKMLESTEATTATERAAVEAELTGKRAQLSRWEANLDAISKTWAALREQEKQWVLAERQEWTNDRERFRTLTQAMNEARVNYAEVLARVAPLELAKLELTKPEERKLRVLTKRWESHFKRLTTEVNRSVTALVQQQAECERHGQALLDLSEDVEARRLQMSTLQRQEDQHLLAEDRIEAETSHLLSFERAKRQQATAELDRLRDELADLTERLNELAPDYSADIVALHPSHRKAG